LLTQAAARNEPIGRIAQDLLLLLDSYGAAELALAIAHALERGVAHPNAVRLALTLNRQAQQQLPPAVTALPAHIKARDVVVRPPRLDVYDRLVVNAEDRHD